MVLSSDDYERLKYKSHFEKVTNFGYGLIVYLILALFLFGFVTLVYNAFNTEKELAAITEFVDRKVTWKNFTGKKYVSYNFGDVYDGDTIAVKTPPKTTWKMKVKTSGSFLKYMNIREYREGAVVPIKYNGKLLLSLTKGSGFEYCIISKNDSE